MYRGKNLEINLKKLTVCPSVRLCVSMFEHILSHHSVTYNVSVCAKLLLFSSINAWLWSSQQTNYSSVCSSVSQSIGRSFERDR